MAASTSPPLRELAEDHMLAIQPGSKGRGDEELGAIGVGSGIGHAQKPLLVMQQLEILIGEFLSVDRFATGAVAGGEITAWHMKPGMMR